MKAWFRKLPLPVSSLMLGMAALGNLLAPYHMGTRNLLGLAAGTILLLLMIKVLLFPECLQEGFRQPLTASTMATFPMSVMILSTYIRPWMPTAAYTAWQLSIGLSVMLVILFTRKFLLHFSLVNVLPSWFVLYVGIVAASVTAPAYGMERLGQMVFWFGLLVYILLVPLVTYRLLSAGSLPEPAGPSLIIYAAPASLLLTGYLASFPVKDVRLLFPLAIWAFLMTIYATVQVARLLVTLPFYPSFSAFTFPFVISAIAFSRMTGYLVDAGYRSSWFVPIRTFSVLGSTLLVFYVFFQYVFYMTTSEKTGTLSDKENLGGEAETSAPKNESASNLGTHIPAGDEPFTLPQDFPVSGKEKEPTKDRAV